MTKLALINLDAIAQSSQQSPHILNCEDMELLHGAYIALNALRATQWTAVVFYKCLAVKNRELTTLEQHEINQALLKQLPQLEAVLFCCEKDSQKFYGTHKDSTDLFKCEAESSAWLPAPGMFRWALKEWDVETLTVVSDFPDDHATAISAGLLSEDAKRWRDAHLRSELCFAV